MLNIVHFIHGLNTGGAETLVKEYALNLDKTKFKLTILCFDNLNSPYDALLAAHNIQIIYLCNYMPLYGKRNIFARVINLLQRYYLSHKFLHKLKPDIVHIHLPINSYIKFARLPKTTKIFYTQHFDVERYKQNYPQDIKALRWLIQHYSTQLIALNDTMRKQLNEMFGVSNTVVLNNGINLARFQHAKSKKQIRKELNIPQNAFVLGHIGRLNPIKNQSFLIDIAAEIFKQNPNTWLLLVGNGQDHAKLEQKIINCGLQKNYLILSNRTDIPDLLAAMDRFVFPSISEGLGIAIIEAQAAGLPCIVSNTVPKAVSISNLITFKSLQEPISQWVQTVLHTPPMPQYTHLEQWDIVAIIRQLEQLYEH